MPKLTMRQWDEYQAIIKKCQTLEIDARFVRAYDAKLKDAHSHIEKLTAQLSKADAYADKLAAGLPEGMLPKDVELIRDANWQFAQENHELKEQVAALTAQLESNGLERISELSQSADKVLAELGNEKTKMIAALTSRLAEMTAERDGYIADIAGINTYCHNLEYDADILRKRLEQSFAAIEGFKAERDTARKGSSDMKCPECSLEVSGAPGTMTYSCTVPGCLKTPEDVTLTRTLSVSTLYL